jgi:preprotein translocase subunit YajC
MTVQAATGAIRNYSICVPVPFQVFFFFFFDFKRQKKKKKKKKKQDFQNKPFG